MIRVSSCAQTGILLTGVNIPLRRTKIDHKEESRKHRLLLGGRDGRDRQTEAGKRYQVDGRKQIDDPHIAHRQQPVDKPGDTGAYREQDKTDHPKRYQLGEQEQSFRDRCHVDLFDRPFLLFAHDVQGGNGNLR